MILTEIYKNSAKVMGMAVTRRGPCRFDVGPICRGAKKFPKKLRCDGVELLSQLFSTATNLPQNSRFTPRK